MFNYNIQNNNSYNDIDANNHIIWNSIRNKNFGVIGINNHIIENITRNHHFRNNTNHIIISFLYNSKLILFF